MGRRANLQHTERFVLFDVLYEDGLRTSNRKVPTSELSSIDGDAVAKTYIEAQDRKIAETSGKPRASIKSASRCPSVEPQPGGRQKSALQSWRHRAWEQEPTEVYVCDNDVNAAIRVWKKMRRYLPVERLRRFY